MVNMRLCVKIYLKKVLLNNSFIERYFSITSYYSKINCCINVYVHTICKNFVRIVQKIKVAHFKIHKGFIEYICIYAYGYMHIVLFRS